MVGRLSDLDEINDLFRSNGSYALLRLKRLTGDDQLDEGRETVFTSAESRHQGVRGVGVAGGERPTQGISHDLADHRPPKVVGLRADQLLPQLLQAVDFSAIGQFRLRCDRLLRSLLAKGGPLAVTLPVPHGVVFFERDAPGIDLAMAAIAGRLIAMDGERLRNRQVFQLRLLAVEFRHIRRRGRGGGRRADS